MADEWILDVLVDLRTFAERNGLGLTERHLDQVMITVSDELASMRGIAQGTARGIGHVGKLYRPAAESRLSQRTG